MYNLIFRVDLNKIYKFIIFNLNVYSLIFLTLIAYSVLTQRLNFLLKHVDFDLLLRKHGLVEVTLYIFLIPLMPMGISIWYLFKTRVEGFKLISAIISIFYFLWSLSYILFFLARYYNLVYGCRDNYLPNFYPEHCEILLGEGFLFLKLIYPLVIFILNIFLVFTTLYVALHCFYNKKIKEEYINLKN